MIQEFQKLYQAQIWRPMTPPAKPPKRMKVSGLATFDLMPNSVKTTICKTSLQA
jgi:hypothetical protein